MNRLFARWLFCGCCKHYALLVCETFSNILLFCNTVLLVRIEFLYDKSCELLRLDDCHTFSVAVFTMSLNSLS